MSNKSNNDHYPWAMIRIAAEKQELNLRPSPTVNTEDALTEVTLLYGIIQKIWKRNQPKRVSLP